MTVDRISLTIPIELGVQAREAARARGESLSAWITQAVESRLRNQFLGDALTAYENEFGAFTAQEMEKADALMQRASRRHVS